MRLPGFLRRGNSAASLGRSGERPTRAGIRTILGLLLALDALLLLLLVVWPPGPSPQTRQKEFQRLRDQREAARSVVEQMRELKAKLQGAIQNGRQFSQQNFLLREGAFSTMLADLERLASQNRLRTAAVNYRLNEEPEQELVKVQVIMTVEGEYSDLVHFINRLEQSQLFWIIDSLNVSGSPGRGLRLNLQMDTYFVPS